MISKEDVKKLSLLARVGISEEEIPDFQEKLAGILDFISTLNEAKTEGGGEGVKKGHSNVLRKDGNPYEPAKFSQAILNEAPEKEDSLIKVKRIFGE